jgi:hypothetical protein
VTRCRALAEPSGDFTPEHAVAARGVIALAMHDENDAIAFGAAFTHECLHRDARFTRRHAM